MISNGFKKGMFYSHHACMDDGCLNAVCSLGHMCKCSLHTKLGPVLTAFCFDVLSNGNRAKGCIIAAEQRQKSLDKGCMMCNGSSKPSTSSSSSWARRQQQQQQPGEEAAAAAEGELVWWSA